jgi:hypothetical protein
MGERRDGKQQCEKAGRNRSAHVGPPAAAGGLSLFIDQRYQCLATGLYVTWLFAAASMISAPFGRSGRSAEIDAYDRVVGFSAVYQ